MAEKFSPGNMPIVAVVGSGYWGKNLVRNFHNLGAVRLICDKNEMVLENFREQYPEVETCLAYNDVLSRDRRFKGVVIATPAETHFRLAREALLAGKHVFVEKPLVLDENEGEELIASGQRKRSCPHGGASAAVPPGICEIKKLEQAGELGRINYIYSNRLNLGKIRREENILWSFAPHDISMILSLAGEEPEKVSATGGNYLHQKIADVTTTHLEFPSGLQAHIFVSWLHPFKEQKLVVVGDRKMAVFDDTQAWAGQAAALSAQNQLAEQHAGAGQSRAERVDNPQGRAAEGRMSAFPGMHVRTASKPITDGGEGLSVLKVFNASQISLDQNGRKIRIQKNCSCRESVDR